MEDHLNHRLPSEVEHAFDSYHQPRANKNWADEPHVSEVGENMSFSHIPESQNCDCCSDREKDHAQCQITVTCAITSAKSRGFLIPLLDLAQPIWKERTLENRGHISTPRAIRTPPVRPQHKNFTNRQTTSRQSHYWAFQCISGNTRPLQLTIYYYWISEISLESSYFGWAPTKRYTLTTRTALRCDQNRSKQVTSSYFHTI